MKKNALVFAFLLLAAVAVGAGEIPNAAAPAEALLSSPCRAQNMTPIPPAEAETLLLLGRVQIATPIQTAESDLPATCCKCLDTICCPPPGTCVRCQGSLISCPCCNL